MGIFKLDENIKIFRISQWERYRWEIFAKASRHPWMNASSSSSSSTAREDFPMGTHHRPMVPSNALRGKITQSNNVLFSREEGRGLRRRYGDGDGDSGGGDGGAMYKSTMPGK
ncbi:hypothetical protein M0804_002873 [Polistes exclamans]|nr:hypothetical protein M0804_002873 [Polistes exclamans]